MSAAPADSRAEEFDGLNRESSARDRANLIEQIYRSAAASDYADSGGRDAAPAGRRQRALVTAAGLAIAGLVISLGVSSRILNAPVVVEQRAALRERIDAADLRGDELAASITDLRQQILDAQAAELEATAVGRTLAEAISRNEVVTGYVGVTGPGATVTLRDAEVPDPDDPSLSRVLDADVQEAVNGLWEAGAEAIAVNGQRLTARSAIRSAAGAILVNYRPLSPPYVIEAIGSPALASAFEDTASADDLRAVARQFGLGFDTRSSSALTLPAAAAALPDHAEILDTEGTPE